MLVRNLEKMSEQFLGEFEAVQRPAELESLPAELSAFADLIESFGESEPEEQQECKFADLDRFSGTDIPTLTTYRHFPWLRPYVNPWWNWRC